MESRFIQPQPRRLRRLCCIATVCVFGCCQAAWAQESEPFRTRNLNPLASIFGLPVWHVSQDSQRFSITSELANHYSLSRRVDDALILDGETWRTGFAFSTTVNEQWSVDVEIPVYQQSGGVLDDTVDGWHSLFGLPDGGRNNRPEDVLRFQLADANGVFLDLSERDQGLGDIQVSIGHPIGPDERYLLTGVVKLATGDEDNLTGSGSTDWAVTLLRSQSGMFRDRAAGYFWGVGLLRTGEAKRIAYEREELVYVGILGGSLKLLPHFGLKAQIDVHAPFFNTPLEEIGQTSIQATLGGWWDMNERSVIEFAISEDLNVSTGPDVVLHIGFRWAW